ncbi:hypothetical protein GOX2725 (plasmid) [Gluconobacter oxydans 621H]|uniref:Uncharacterized protein n=1 Tax=Gluconobacter oxydans (strain 621H) TaxID=290633 RepID=Q5HXG5_GLUOX|nr:hypothetical protein [Gluconobacter oxydans]AAW59789.1 hypothetical protein GOX2725 [Gluconobacter oxydans 621H]
MIDLELKHMPGMTTGYMCKTDYDHELGEATGGVRVYASLADLKAAQPCVETCGIVQVGIRFLKLVQNANWDRVQS